MFYDHLSARSPVILGHYDKQASQASIKYLCEIINIDMFVATPQSDTKHHNKGAGI